MKRFVSLIVCFIMIFLLCGQEDDYAEQQFLKPAFNNGGMMSLEIGEFSYYYIDQDSEVFPNQPNNTLIRFDYNSGERLILAEDVVDFISNGKIIYFVSGVAHRNQIWSIKCDGTDKELIHTLSSNSIQTILYCENDDFLVFELSDGTQYTLNLSSAKSSSLNNRNIIEEMRYSYIGHLQYLNANRSEEAKSYAIYDINKDTNIYESFVEKEIALKIIKICKENSIFFNIYTNQGIITESLNYNVKVFNNENSFRPNNKRTNIQVVNNVETYIQDNEFKILKIIICDESRIIFNNIIEKLKNVKGVEVLDVEHMSKKIIRIGTEEYKIEYFYTEVTNQNTNKWSAIQVLAKKLEISEDQIIGIGDNMNDFEMVKNAGLGITMKNSALEKQGIADYVTEDNNSDGVGNAIYKFI